MTLVLNEDNSSKLGSGRDFIFKLSVGLLFLILS